MLLKNFFINVSLRVVLIVLSTIVLGILLQHFEEGYYYTLTGMIFLTGFQTWLLIRQVNKTNTDLEKFLSAVQDNDSSIRFPESVNSASFRKLHDRINNINLIIHNIKIQNERTSQFLQSVVDHVDIGLLSFDLDGKIGVYNKAAKKYLKAEQPQQLSSFIAPDSDLVSIIHSIRPGQELLHKMKVNNQLQNILVKATELRFENNAIKLVSFQDITDELDKKELDSWQKLIRVLTHEIMNSISPITSLTSVISGYFRKKNDENPVQAGLIDSQIITKTLSGLNTIEETGKGLLDFVDKYRSLTSLPTPNLSKFSVDSLFRKCKLLMEANIPAGIEITTAVNPEDLQLVADYAQAEQILINLIKNAIEAFSDRKKGLISLKAFSEADSIMIQVEDDGPGIQNDIIEDIFIPFFTTRKSGSGIGLSLSRQIMKNHAGTISVNSTPGKGSVFTLKFQQ
jgi:two-component system, NtrC family, nitrogen regulation sensor histidine kinase NtrY